MSSTKWEQERPLADTWFEKVFGLMTEPVLLFDASGCRDANSAALKLFGFGDRRFLRQCLLSDLAPPVQPDGEDSDQYIEKLLACARNGGGNGPCLLRHADGSTFWADVSASEVEVDGEAMIHVGIRDTSTERGLEDSIDALRNALHLAHEKLQHATRKVDYVAATDPISGLWSAKHLRKLADIEADRARRYSQPVSIVAGTISNSDALLTASGETLFDSFWIDLAALINRNVRTPDAVARLAPGAFAVLTPATDIDAANVVAEKLQRAIAEHEFTQNLRPRVVFTCAQYRSDEEPFAWLRRAAGVPLDSNGQAGP